MRAALSAAGPARPPGGRSRGSATGTAGVSTAPERRRHVLVARAAGSSSSHVAAPSRRRVLAAERLARVASTAAPSVSSRIARQRATAPRRLGPPQYSRECGPRTLAAEHHPQVLLDVARPRPAPVVGDGRAEAEEAALDLVEQLLAERRARTARAPAAATSDRTARPRRCARRRCRRRRRGAGCPAALQASSSASRRSSVAGGPADHAAHPRVDLLRRGRRSSLRG